MTPHTEAELEAELTDLLTAADENGVDVRGGWTVTTTEEGQVLDIHITEVERESE